MVSTSRYIPRPTRSVAVSRRSTRTWPWWMSAMWEPISTWVSGRGALVFSLLSEMYTQAREVLGTLRIDMPSSGQCGGAIGRPASAVAIARALAVANASSDGRANRCSGRRAAG